MYDSDQNFLTTGLGRRLGIFSGGDHSQPGRASARPRCGTVDDVSEHSTSDSGDRQQMDRHVDPNSQSLVWRVDDVLDDTTPGDWITEALPRFDYTVGSLVPPIYTLYSRVLHPAARIDADTGEQNPVRWAQVAAHTGGVIHQTVEWGSLLQAGFHRGVGDGRDLIWHQEPDEGDMPEEQFAALAEVLVEHTGTPDDCWFGFWEGRAGHDLHLASSGPRLRLPHRDNYLVHGTVRDAVRTGVAPEEWTLGCVR
ncbi:hypothetical protein [Rhodococcus rhodochrous]|uniref:hypothetical protein n=1 Tax=Rhodococcus rhodochrous TaxID=1829 RepID=UPI001C94A760|nr:hypothetical protein [Rhodococcus rhodochrous]